MGTDHTPAAERDRVKSVVALRCVEDHWPVAATSCITAAANLDAAHGCIREHLTVAQHERLMAVLKPESTEHVADKPPAVIEPDTSPTSSSGGQAEIAAKLNDDGSKLFMNGSFANASMKFRQAVSRVPEPRYFFNLCLALFQEGKFAEALTACNAGTRENPPAPLRQKLDKATDMIKREAKAQGVTVGP